MTLIPLSEAVRIVREHFGDMPEYRGHRNVIVQSLQALPSPILAPVVEVPGALNRLIDMADDGTEPDGSCWFLREDIAAARAELATLREFKKLADEYATGLFRCNTEDDGLTTFERDWLARYRSVATKEQA